MTNTFTIVAIPDSNGAMAISWDQSKLDVFGQFPSLIIELNGRPHADFNFSAQKPLVNPTMLNIYGVIAGQIINITAIKG